MKTQGQTHYTNRIEYGQIKGYFLSQFHLYKGKAKYVELQCHLFNEFHFLA